MKTKTMDDWDELAEALSEALPCGVEVDFPGKDDDEDTDLRLIVDGGGNARLIIDLGDEDRARSVETFYLEWGVNDGEEGFEEEADFTWQSSDWMRSGAGWTNEGDEALRWAPCSTWSASSPVGSATRGRSSTTRRGMSRSTMI